MALKSILMGACVLIGNLYVSCGVSPALQEELKDPAKTLQVTVRSIPSGARVYGITRDKPGTLLGTTPFVCSYMVVRSGHSPEILGSVPVGETIVSDMQLRNFARGSADYTFQCMVQMDGYQTAIIKKLLVDDTPINLREFSTSDVFKGGRSVDIMVTLPPLTADSTVINK